MVAPPVAIVQPFPLYRRAWCWMDEHGAAIQSFQILVVSFLFFVVWWAFSVNSRLDYIGENVNQMKGDVGRLGGELARVSERVTKLEGKFEAFEAYILPKIAQQVYKPKAFELGFIDPQFVPLKLAKSAEARITQSGDMGVSYNFIFTVKEVEKDHIMLLVDGNVEARSGKHGKFVIRGNLISIPTQIGEPVNLWDALKRMSLFPEGAEAPPLWLVIMDFPVGLPCSRYRDLGDWVENDIMPPSVILLDFLSAMSY